VRARDGTDAVKVVDFGIAKLVGNDASQEVTKTGLVIGTPEFMSPEQLSGDKLDGRSDIYSLGLVFFKTLTGRLPFEAGTVQETMIQRLTEEPLKLAAARPDLRFPPGLQGTLDSALARSPVERYQSAAKFANDVASVTSLARRSSPIPVARGDAEDRTRLLDSRAVAALSLPRRTPVPPVRRGRDDGVRPRPPSRQRGPPGHDAGGAAARGRGFELPDGRAAGAAAAGRRFAHGAPTVRPGCRRDPPTAAPAHRRRERGAGAEDARIDSFGPP